MHKLNPVTQQVPCTDRLHRIHGSTIKDRAQHAEDKYTVHRNTHETLCDVSPGVISLNLIIY